MNPGQPPVTPPVATGSAALDLQGGAFRDTENARRLQNRLQQEGFSSVRIQRDMLWGAPISRVQIGPLESVPSADQTSARLTGLGHESVRVIVE
ncbi:MAG: SPOR domain-containing protein [Gammaproteobacteria bacterium]|nr:SPOR domain-containing protein [Gammaproteobacteria bacterium]